MSNNSIISDSFNLCNRYAPGFMNKQVPFWVQQTFLETNLLSDDSKIRIANTISPADGEKLKLYCDCVKTFQSGINKVATTPASLKAQCEWSAGKREKKTKKRRRYKKKHRKTNRV
jgi:hypothetical protein